MKDVVKLGRHPSHKMVKAFLDLLRYVLARADLGAVVKLDVRYNDSGKATSSFFGINRWWQASSASPDLGALLNVCTTIQRRRRPGEGIFDVRSPQLALARSAQLSDTGA